MKKSLIALLLVFSIGAAQAQMEFEQYCNTNYNFCVEYPTSFNAQGESARGDGQEFTRGNEGVSLLVYANLTFSDNEGFLKEYKKLSTNSSKNKVATKFIKQNMFIVSWSDDAKIYYQKTMLIKDSYCTCLFSYKKKDAKIFNSLCKYIANSFKQQ